MLAAFNVCGGEGAGYRLRAASYQLPVVSCQSPVATSILIGTKVFRKRADLYFLGAPVQQPWSVRSADPIEPAQKPRARGAHERTREVKVVSQA
jgi:hypothetical protein